MRISEEINFAYLPVDEKKLLEWYLSKANILEIRNTGGGLMMLRLEKFRSWLDENEEELYKEFGCNESDTRLIMLPIKKIPTSCILFNYGKFSSAENAKTA